jgi:L-amino acid N-acyltransferase YncA
MGFGTKSGSNTRKAIKMELHLREYESGDMEAVRLLWNQVVEDGVAFPQEDVLTKDEADAFFRSQTYTGVAEDAASGEIVGMYILHPNNVGRCGHICNASYAVRRDLRGVHIGEQIVKDCLAKAHDKGFRILQFNAVVANNIHAIHLYERLGFQRIGTVPGGFHMPDGSYEDIILFYHSV